MESLYAELYIGYPPGKQGPSAAAPGNADLPIGSVTKRANNKARHQRLSPELPQVAEGLQRRLPGDLPGEVEEERKTIYRRRRDAEIRRNIAACGGPSIHWVP